MKMRLVAAVIATMAFAGPAHALVIDAGTGEVTDWGVTPFAVAGLSQGQAGNTAYTLANDYAPIKYPDGVGHQPSPGGSSGELLDLEEMYVRMAGDLIQVLLVTSSSYEATVGDTWKLGDLFLDVAGQRYGMVTQSASQQLAAGSVYLIADDGDVEGLQQGNLSYYGSTKIVENDYGPDATIPEIAGPWAVTSGIDAGQLLGSGTIATGTHDYGGTEDGTFLIEYTLDASLVGATPSTNISTRQTWGCGNDVIRVTDYVVPEPATMALLGTGLGILLIARRKK